MTQKSQGIGRVPDRSSSDPNSRYNHVPGGSYSPSSNLGARPAGGQLTPHRTLRKLDEAVPLSGVIGLQEVLDEKLDTAARGSASGVAPLDGLAQVPLGNLPLPLDQAQTHNNADTDSDPTAIHHTIGSGANQAAAGDHTHTLVFSLPAFFVDGGLSVGNVASRLPVDGDYTILGVRLTVGTAPTGADIIVDVNKNGSTIFTTAANQPRILATANMGGPGTTPDIPSITAGDYLTIDIDQVGSGTAGSNLVVCIVVSKVL